MTTINDLYCPNHHGFFQHECGCIEKESQNKKLDVLAEKIYLIHAGVMFGPDDAYEFAKEFLDYKRERNK